MRSVRTAAVVLGGLLMAACGPTGSGDLVTEDRSVDAFDSIEISGGLDLDLLVDESATHAVSVTFDDNLIDRVTTTVRGSTLVIEAGSYTITGGGRFIAVTAPGLRALEASGGTDVNGAGETAELALEASGGTGVDLSGLTTGRLTLDASGGADVVVFVTDEVAGEASGGADVTVLGNPARIDISSSGGADVETG